MFQKKGDLNRFWINNESPSHRLQCRLGGMNHFHQVRFHVGLSQGGLTLWLRIYNGTVRCKAVYGGETALIMHFLLSKQQIQWHSYGMGEWTKSHRKGTSFSPEFNNFFCSYNVFQEIKIDLRDIRMYSFEVIKKTGLHISGLITWSCICIVSNLREGKEVLTSWRNFTDINITLFVWNNLNKVPHVDVCTTPWFVSHSLLLGLGMLFSASRRALTISWLPWAKPKL